MRPRKELDYASIAKCFCLPVEEAAKVLGVGTTHLKKCCRNYGIRRWPFRKYKEWASLQSAVDASPKHVAGAALVEEKARAPVDSLSVASDDSVYPDSADSCESVSGGDSDLLEPKAPCCVKRQRTISPIASPIACIASPSSQPKRRRLDSTDFIVAQILADFAE